MSGHAGLFITFEGIDGSGKSTQAQLLEQWLREQQRTTLRTFEPGDTVLGQEIRTLLLHAGHVAPRAEALLYAADRAQHIDMVVRPALDRGEVVIQDRYLDSSIAYQGAGRELDPGDIRGLSVWATDGLLPQLTFLLDLPVDEAHHRLQRSQVSGLDRLEREKSEFHQRVRDFYLSLARDEPERIVVIDATEDPAQIQRRIRDRVASLFGVG